MRPLAIDVGNVICKMDANPFISKLSEIAHISKEDAWRFFRLGTAEHDLGHISIHDQMMRELGVSDDAANYLIQNFWNPMLEVDVEILTSLLNFLDEGGKLAILSNMGHEHFKMMKEKLKPLYDCGGENIIRHYSCEVGVRKPSKLFYQSFLIDHPSFRGALYMDDLSENIEAGKKAGFEGFQFNLWDDDKSEKLKTIEEKLRL